MTRPGDALIKLTHVTVVLSMAILLTRADPSTLGDPILMAEQQPEITEYENERSEDAPGLTEQNEDWQPISLQDVLNRRVNGASEMCPRQYVILFFLTGNMEYLRPCMGTQNASSSGGHGVGQGSESRQTNGDSSYSGRLLKRILQNMNAGTIKVHIPPYRAERAPMKRSRLSINSALTSLADMLRHENGRQRNKQPVYGFHSKLLKMG